MAYCERKFRTKSVTLRIGNVPTAVTIRSLSLQANRHA